MCDGLQWFSEMDKGSLTDSMSAERGLIMPSEEQIQESP